MQALILSENTSIKQFEKHAVDEMKKVIDFFEKELSKLRTSRATPSLIEDILVSVYGQTMPLRNIAVVSASDALTLVVQPFDVSAIGDIEKSLSQKTDLGALPRNDGKVIKIAFPPMSQARRQELIKAVSQKHEEAVIAVRKVRQEYLSAVKDAEKGKKISEDLSQRLQKQLQISVDGTVQKLNSVQSAKEASLKE